MVNQRSPKPWLGVRVPAPLPNAKQSSFEKLQFEEGSTVTAQIGSRLHLRVIWRLAKDEALEGYDSASNHCRLTKGSL